MFSSTSLIRQSKQIFDKLNTNEIAKAVILRDGKPSFVMLDFDKYEAMMSEYEILLDTYKNTKQTNIQIKQQINTQIVKEEDSIPNIVNQNKQGDFEMDLSDETKEHSNGEIKEFWN
jgi:PHD/YefM family antitoxin component YafN of YafNO toxin-antitoxin module